MLATFCISLSLTAYSQHDTMPPPPKEGVFAVLENIENILDLTDKQKTEISKLISEVTPEPPPLVNKNEISGEGEELKDEAALYAEHMNMNSDKIEHDRDMVKLEAAAHLGLQKILTEEQLGTLHKYHLKSSEG